MTMDIILYSRKNCCLCDEMKEVVGQVAAHHSLTVHEFDVDTSPDWREKFGDEVPVLFINGRKAFKYRVTAQELERRLRKENPVS